VLHLQHWRQSRHRYSLAGVNALVIKQVAQVLLQELHAFLQVDKQTV